MLDLSEQGIDLAQRLDLIAPHFYAVGVVVVGRVELNHVASDAKRAAAEIMIVSIVKNFDQPLEQLLAGDVLAFLEHQQHAVVSLGRAQTVDAADAGNDHAVAAFE